MAKLSIKVGTTSKTVKIFVQDSSQTTEAGLTGLVFNTSSLVAYYIKEGQATATAITLVTATVGTWVSGGFVAVDGTNMPGLYEIGLPNLALSTAQSVVVYLKGAANMSPVRLEIELTAVDNQDAVHGGLSALPNAAAGAVNGLPLGDASGRVLLQPTQTGVTIPTVTTTTNLTTNNDKTGYTVSTVSDKTGYALTTGEHTAISGTDVPTALTAQGYTTARAAFLDTLNGLVAAIWNALTSGMTTTGSVGKKLAGWTLGTDNKSLLSTDAQTGVTIPTVTAVTNAVALSTQDEAVMTKFNTMLNSTPAFTALALALAPTGGSAPTVTQIRQEMDTNSTKLASILAALPTMAVLATISDTGPTTTVFKGSAGLSAVDSFYVGQFLVFINTATLLPQARKITGYVGATKQFTFTTAFVGTPANGDPFLIAGDVAA